MLTSSAPNTVITRCDARYISARLTRHTERLLYDLRVNIDSIKVLQTPCEDRST